MTAFTVTDANKETFETDGVVCLRNVLTEQDINKLRIVTALQEAGTYPSTSRYDFEALAKQVWAMKDYLSQPNAPRFDVPTLAAAIVDDLQARPLLEEGEASQEGKFFYDAAMWRDSSDIRDVAFDSPLPCIIAALLGSRTLHFWEDTTFIKAPGTKQKTAFHQDYTFTQALGNQGAVAWIALDPCNNKNGVLKYVKGSHLWGKEFAPNMLISQTPLPGARDERCPDIEANESNFDIISYDVKPGDVLIHHIKTLHGSGGNLTQHNRRAISFRYSGDDTVFYHRPGSATTTTLSQTIKDGDPLYAEDFPLVWPKPWPGVSLSKLYRDTCKSTKPNEIAA